MTQSEVLVPNERITAKPEILAHNPEEVIAMLANHPGKMLTLLALSTAPNDYLTGTELAQRLDSLQAETSPFKFGKSHTTAFSYCKKTLAPTGLVTLDHKKSSSGKIAEAARITEYGQTVGVAVAGAFLSLELQHPDISFQELIGFSRQYNQATGTHSRMAIYESLMREDNGTLSITALQENAGLSLSAAQNAIRELQRSGIVEIADKNDPSQRIFRFSEPDTHKINLYISRMHPGLVAAIKVITSMQRAGKFEATGAEIQEALKAQEPSIDLRAAWHIFQRWTNDTNRQTSFVHEVQFDENSYAYTRVELSSKYYPYIKQLLQVRSLLLGGPETSSAFYQFAKAKAQEIINNPEWVSQLVAKGRQNSPSSKTNSHDWLTELPQLVPAEGIPVNDLHRLVQNSLGKAITYKRLRNALNTHNELDVRSDRNGTGMGHVTLKKIVFSSEWQTDAECRPSKTEAEKRVPKIDPKMPFPELFFPPGTKGPSLEQAEEAKSHCARCVVRLACLKTSLETRGASGVWGGMTQKEREEMPLKDRNRIRARVQIGEARD